MKDQAIEQETRMYIYDLMNTAQEHGFKETDSWEISMVNESGKSKLQKDYYPAVAVKIVPEMLLQVLNSTRARLKQSFAKDAPQPDMKDIQADGINYLVAFNLKRPRG